MVWDARASFTPFPISLVFPPSPPLFKFFFACPHPPFFDAPSVTRLTSLSPHPYPSSPPLRSPLPISFAFSSSSFFSTINTSSLSALTRSHRMATAGGAAEEVVWYRCIGASSQREKKG